MFDPSKCKREHFANTRSYEAAMWAGEMCNRMLDLKASGNTFFFEGDVIDPCFRIGYGQNFEISLELHENGYLVFVGDVQDEVKGEWKVWCTKKSLTEFFKRFKFISPGQYKSLI